MRGIDTLSYEFAEQCPDASHVYVPTGGGGLISSVARGLAHRGHPAKIVACQPAGCAPIARCLSGELALRLRPLFVVLTAGDRPQTTISWLRRPPGHGPRLLGQMARGQTPIAHTTFDELPSDRAHNYLRDLLVAVGVLPRYEPTIARMESWLAGRLAELPREHAHIIGRFARWNVLRRLRTQATRRPITRSMIDRGRMQINAAIRLLAWTNAHRASVTTLTQNQFEHYLSEHPPGRTMQYGFVLWLNTTGINSQIALKTVTPAAPAITVSDADRWRHVDALLHDDSIRHYTRIGGLFMLLFAQPLAGICMMRTDQITLHDDGTVSVTFDSVPIQMPELLDGLIREHMNRRGQSLLRRP